MAYSRCRCHMTIIGYNIIATISRLDLKIEEIRLSRHIESPQQKKGIARTTRCSTSKCPITYDLIQVLLGHCTTLRRGWSRSRRMLHWSTRHRLLGGHGHIASICARSHATATRRGTGGAAGRGHGDWLRRRSGNPMSLVV